MFVNGAKIILIHEFLAQHRSDIEPFEYEFINSGLVNVNHLECLNNSKLLKENDVISVRHKGRIYVNEIIRKTKSDRLAIKIGFLK